MQYSYNAARGARGGSFTFTINTDSIKYDGSKKIETKNSLSNWNKVTSSVNLTEFDKIKTGSFRSHVDAPDFMYVITTDKRVHSICKCKV